jgi:hypothetical protein
VVERADGVLAVKVLDFGISKSGGLGSSGASMTKTSAAMGSPLYMSPEQMHSAKDVDPRGDIWALGVVLFELLSARSPFEGETMAELVLKVVTAAPPPLRSVRPDAPAGLESVILKCLQKDRAHRYQTVGELAVALLEFAPKRARGSVDRISGIMQRAGMSTSSPALPVLLAPADVGAQSHTPPPGTMATWGQTKPLEGNRKRMLLVVATLVALPMLAVAAIALHHTRAAGARSETAAPPPPASVVGAPVVVPAVPVETSSAISPEPAVAPEPALSAVVAPPVSASPVAAHAPVAPQHHPATKAPGKPSPVPSPAAPAAASPASAPAKPSPTSKNNPLKMHIE